MNYGKITTPKRRLYFLGRKVKKHQDLLIVLAGISAIILLTSLKIYLHN